MMTDQAETITEDMIDVLGNVELDIENCIIDFCNQNNIECLRTEKQDVWNACLLYIKKTLFSDRHIMMIHNKYDIDIVHKILDCYIYQCNLNCKMVSVMGFHKLTGISRDEIYQWGSDSETYFSGSGKRLTSKHSDIFKKLNSEQEESLVSKVMSGGNPLGPLSVLNHRYGWNQSANVNQVIGYKPIASRESLGISDSEFEKIALPGAKNKED